jgi:hypothetical protein
VAADIRGAKQAKYTTQEQFAGFHRMMAQARVAGHEAQELAGDDPCPYIAEISCAFGLGYGHDDFRALWAEIEKRDAHHLAAHTSALQYWCRKWRGSHELAERFAREAAAKGSPGLLLSFLPLYAAFEQETAVTASRGAYQKVLAASGHGEIITEILPADGRTFRPAEAYHQQYLDKNPRYCGIGRTGVSCPIGVAPADG